MSFHYEQTYKRTTLINQASICVNSVKNVFPALWSFHERHSHRTEQAIQAIVTNFHTNFMFLDIKPPTSVRIVRTEENIAAVAVKVAVDCDLSIRRRSQRLGLCYTTMWKILKDLGFKAYSQPEAIKKCNICCEKCTVWCGLLHLYFCKDGDETIGSLLPMVFAIVKWFSSFMHKAAPGATQHKKRWNYCAINVVSNSSFVFDQWIGRKIWRFDAVGRFFAGVYKISCWCR